MKVAAGVMIVDEKDLVYHSYLHGASWFNIAPLLPYSV